MNDQKKTEEVKEINLVDEIVSPTGESEDVAFFADSAEDDLMIQAVFRRC